jgi:Integral membrane protein CcmA involved in cell shape determination
MKPMHNDSRQNNIIAFLGKETYFKGYLHFEGTVRIDGKLEGEIHSKDVLIVGEGANIKCVILKSKKSSAEEMLRVR